MPRRKVFVSTDADNPHYDAMSYCVPRFVSDYNYNKMIDFRLGVEDQPGDSEHRGPSLEIGAVQSGSLSSSTQPPSSPRNAGDYFLTLQDAFQREIYREPMTLLTATHGEASRSRAVRVSVPEDTPVFLAILDAQGTPLFIEPIVVPPVKMLESNP